MAETPQHDESSKSATPNNLNIIARKLFLHRLQVLTEKELTTPRECLGKQLENVRHQLRENKRAILYKIYVQSHTHGNRHAPSSTTFYQVGWLTQNIFRQFVFCTSFIIADS